MYNENTSHSELIVKDGTVTIPSIFMFEHFKEVTALLDRANEMNCTVIFENENVKILPGEADSEIRFKLYAYSAIIDHREIGNAYVRYVGSPQKMSWDKVEKA